MKYRRLAPSQLEELRDDFVQFLAANSIPADDWVKLKQAKPEAANELIDIFSDIVWEKVVSKIKFLERRAKRGIRVFSFGEEKAEMVEIKVPDGSLDFTDPEQIKSIAAKEIDLKKYAPEVVKGSKEYPAEQRGLEVFQQLSDGAIPCEEVLFLSVKSMLPKK